MNHPEDLLTACLLGGALGDSLGLPAEGLSADRIARRWSGPWKHRLIAGHGMVSDDTEHAVMTALSLLKNGADPAAFARDLAARLRWWFAGIPAGIGLATARSILKLWCGVSPARSGVFSAGNGPLMRAAVNGVRFRTEPAQRGRLIEASTRITHTDPRALEAANLIASAAALAANGVTDPHEVLSTLGPMVESAEMKARLPLLAPGLAAWLDVGSFADSFGRRPGFVSGFAPDSATVALFAWLRHRGDFRATLESVIRAGGDTDTVAFIAGSLAGIDAGTDGLPRDWLAGLRDWPLGVSFLEKLGPSSRYPVWPLSLFRNAAFLAIVLVHAFRRLAPPY